MRGDEIHEIHEIHENQAYQRAGTLRKMLEMAASRWAGTRYPCPKSSGSVKLPKSRDRLAIDWAARLSRLLALRRRISSPLRSAAPWRGPGQDILRSRRPGGDGVLRNPSLESVAGNAATPAVHRAIPRRVRPQPLCPRTNSPSLPLSTMWASRQIEADRVWCATGAMVGAARAPLCR